MPDVHFEHLRLVALYDVLNGERVDLRPYVELVEAEGAHLVIDLGCGTGVLALLLAASGRDVIAVDPAAGSLDLARTKPGAAAVRWLHGGAGVLDHLDPPARADVVTVTGNTAQAITDAAQWHDTLSSVRRALAPGGLLAVETRDPGARAWEGWTRKLTERTIDVEILGPVTTWVDVTWVDGPLVAFTTTFCFATDEVVLTAESVLRFRGREEVMADLARAGLLVEQVRQAPDRPGLEMVFLARSE
ncbi:class I SAM-dependent methyltransferase [Kineococcus sp. SYSU DK005]|uniref:class I SAM-dependent methyltransferase n=1 Tax=Kineococcus sp. SYSU DK005 TaxID=3383126 RepID=UPI003D7F0026